MFPALLGCSFPGSLNKESKLSSDFSLSVPVCFSELPNSSTKSLGCIKKTENPGKSPPCQYLGLVSSNWFAFFSLLFSLLIFKIYIISLDFSCTFLEEQGKIYLPHHSGSRCHQYFKIMLKKYNFFLVRSPLAISERAPSVHGLLLSSIHVFINTLLCKDSE